MIAPTYIEVDYYEIRFEEGLRKLEKQIDIILARTSKLKRNDIRGDFR